MHSVIFDFWDRGGLIGHEQRDAVPCAAGNETEGLIESTGKGGEVEARHSRYLPLVVQRFK